MIGSSAAIGMAAVAAAGSVASGMISKSGADAAAGSADRAAAMQAEEAKQSRLAMSPWTDSGRAAVDKISQLLGLGHLSNATSTDGRWYVDGANAKADQDAALNAFQTTPGYQWRKTEGINALDRSAASRGLLLSGAQVKGVQGFGDGLASEEYRNYMGDLFNASGQGMGATGSANGTSAALVNGAANSTIAGGAARASGYNALASGIGSASNNLMSGMFMGMGGFGGKKTPGSGYTV